MEFFGITLDKILIPATTALVIGVATLIYNYQARKKSLPNERISILKDIKSIGMSDYEERYIKDSLNEEIKENAIYELSKIKNTVKGERYLKITTSNHQLTQRGKTILRNNIDCFEEKSGLEKNPEGETTTSYQTSFNVKWLRLFLQVLVNTITIIGGIALLWHIEINLVKAIAAYLNHSLENASHEIAIFSVLAIILWLAISYAITKLPNILSFIYILLFLSIIHPYYKNKIEEKKPLQDKSHFFSFLKKLNLFYKNKDDGNVKQKQDKT